jgi:hypothetical protein
VSRRAPTSVVSADKDFTQQAVIDHVEFTDGSVWSRFSVKLSDPTGGG